ncbi:MAG: sodium/proton-translocating pyrophosphatase, partial [Gemmatimonadota bacterium]
MLLALAPAGAFAQEASHGGGEANLRLPDLGSVLFFGSVSGRTLLMAGLVVCALGLLFGLMIYTQLKNMAVHQSMRTVSELIYETCKTYLITQGKFLMVLWLFIGTIITLYFGTLATSVDAAGTVTRGMPAFKVAIILLFSVVGIVGSYGVAWFGIRVNTFANSRTAFASLRGKPYPC